MNRLPVVVNVGHNIRNFIISTQGSDIIDPEKRSMLWCLTKQHLVTAAAADYTPILQESSITILLRSGESMKTYSVSEKRQISIDSFFRCYLSDEGQRAIKRFFTKHYMQLFHIFMEGYAISSENNITYAIKEFCIRYGIEFDDKIYARLRKDWYRHRKKLENSDLCPIVF